MNVIKLKEGGESVFLRENSKWSITSLCTSWVEYCSMGVLCESCQDCGCSGTVVQQRSTDREDVKRLLEECGLKVRPVTAGVIIVPDDGRRRNLCDWAADCPLRRDLSSVGCRQCPAGPMLEAITYNKAVELWKASRIPNRRVVGSANQ